jgi:hypothetical protein
MCIGAGLAIWYAYHGILLWKKAIYLLMLLPFCVMYVLVFLYCLLAMLAYRDVFQPLSFGEKLLTLFIAPFFSLEYFPIFIQSRVYSKTNLKWEETARVEYSKPKK